MPAVVDAIGELIRYLLHNVVDRVFVFALGPRATANFGLHRLYNRNFKRRFANRNSVIFVDPCAIFCGKPKQRVTKDGYHLNVKAFKVMLNALHVAFKQQYNIEWRHGVTHI